MLLIFEQLKFADLLSISQLNVKLSNVGAYAAKRKYSSHKMFVLSSYMESFERGPIAATISNAFSRIGVIKRRKVIKEGNFIILIKTRETIIKTFKHLGVINLELVAFHGHNEMQLMGTLISKYAAETLKRVSFDGSEGIIKYIAKPLINVESVHFSGNIHSKNSGIIPINRVFPSMTSLHLNAFLNATYIDNLNHHMPQLKHFQTNKFDAECDVTRVIQKNPQITSFEAERTTHEYLEKLNSLLPSLGALTLTRFNLGPQMIRFKNVTQFTVKFSVRSLGNLHFPKLKILHLRLNEHEPLDAWINFLAKHQQVTKLSLDGFNYIDYDIDQLIGRLPNVVEMTLQLTAYR